MRSTEFKKSLENTSEYATHEGRVEHLLFLGCAVLISVLEKLEQPTNKSDAAE